MSTLSFKLDQLFILLVPELVVWFEGVVSFPNESDFVQNSLSIKSNFVIVMKVPLCANPPPKRLFLLVREWHPTMSIDSLKLDKLFIVHVPFLI
jgi:hypothetical protein